MFIELEFMFSGNSFVAHKPVSVICRNLIRPNVASKPVCIIPSKPVKCKVTCKPVCNVPSKPVNKFLVKLF